VAPAGFPDPLSGPWTGQDGTADPTPDVPFPDALAEPQTPGRRRGSRSDSGPGLPSTAGAAPPPRPPAPPRGTDRPDSRTDLRAAATVGPPAQRTTQTRPPVVPVQRSGTQRPVPVQRSVAQRPGAQRPGAQRSTAGRPGAAVGPGATRRPPPPPRPSAPSSRPDARRGRPPGRKGGGWAVFVVLAALVLLSTGLLQQLVDLVRDLLP
jgi:hypothetical protein